MDKLYSSYLNCFNQHKLESDPIFSKESFNIKDALFFLKICKLAYLTNISNHNEDIFNILKEWDFKYKVIKKSIGLDIDTECLILSNEKQIVISFSGSESLNDWLTNFSFKLVEGVVVPGKIHLGFRNALIYILFSIASYISELDPFNKKEIWITGHSLGAALSKLLIPILIDNNKNIIGIYSFGSPKIGDKNFINYFDDLIQKNNIIFYNVINYGDLISYIPLNILGFSHETSSSIILLKENKIEQYSNIKEINYYFNLWNYIRCFINVDFKFDLESKHIIGDKNIGYMSNLLSNNY